MQDLDLLQYELMVILPPDLSDQQLKTRLDEIRTAIKEDGGKILHEDLAGIRDMAYRIGKHNRGCYFVFHFEHDPAKVPTVEKTVRIETGVIRHLLIKVPSGYTFKTLKEYDAELESARLKFEQEKAADAADKKRPPVRRPPMKEKPEAPAELPVPEMKKEKALSEAEMQEKLKAEEKKLDSLLDNPDIQI
ncbi:MAG: 30S ribosomal protein S6 [Patescibacteria group bacterium]